jgi:neutral ceramidase
MTESTSLTRRNFLGAAAALAPLQPKAAGDRKLHAGAATVNITPNLGAAIAGNMTYAPAREIHDELHVRSLVLDNGGTRVAFAVVDSCMVPGDLIARAKGLIQDRTGIPPANVLVSATHTHSAPAATHVFQSQPDSKYVEWLAVRIADSVGIAVQRLEPARIGWGVGREERLLFCRRYFMKPGTIPPNPFGQTTERVQMNPPSGSPNILKPEGPIDPDVGIIAVESRQGRPICVIGNYALHYVGGVGNGHISADYFAYWADSIVRLAGVQPNSGYPPFVAILTNACSGHTV